MNEWKKTNKVWMDAYHELTRITSFLLEDVMGESYALVRDSESKYFGQVGICERHSLIDLNTEQYLIKFKPRGKERAVRSTFVDAYGGDKICHALNLPLILKEKEKLSLLFPEMLD